MITVHKLDHLGLEKIAYPGTVLERTATQIVLEAFFTKGPLVCDYVTFKPGDRFIEHFYTNKWYNIFAMFEGGQFKGWYCNITRPAKFEGNHLYADDLALDYFVQPNGAEFILDEEEFNALGLTASEAAAARAALAELRSMAAQRLHPFNLQSLEAQTPQLLSPTTAPTHDSA